MKKGQSNRLTMQQKEGQGPVTIFHKDAQIHDAEVGNTSLFVKKQLEYEFPMLTFRYRKDLSKKEINEALKRVDKYLGQTLFVESASIKPDGGIIEVQDDDGNVNEIANFMLSENYFPYILFLEGSNFLTQNVIVTRPDGRKVTLVYNDGMLNRLDRLTAANYGMPINTNLCENRFVKCNGATIMLQAASIYTKGEGGHWDAKDMIEVMMDVARTSLKMLGKDLFNQLIKK